MVANENTYEENSDYFNKKLCLIKQKFDEIMDENNIVEEQKYVFLNDCRVELNKVVAHDKNNETMQVCLEEYFIEELEKVSAVINKKNECLADENQVCLADSFDSQKEQEVSTYILNMGCAIFVYFSDSIT